MIYITGDTHGDFTRVLTLCDRQRTTLDDTLIILGDAGINYSGDLRDASLKRILSQYPITLFCIHGNHENRPENIQSYRILPYRGGYVYAEDEYPNILFAIDGEVYDFDGKRCMVIGGAYSVDKPYRLATGAKWFPDEQPSEELRDSITKQLKSEHEHRNVDVFLTHTCPARYIPVEAFLPGVDQSSVDRTTEDWLDEIEAMYPYEAWYCGHYHINKNIDKVHFLFDSVYVFDSRIHVM